MMQAQAQTQQKAPNALAQPSFPSATKSLALLSGLKPETKTEPERKQILLQKANVHYIAPAKNRMTMQQAVEEANKLGVILIPNKGIDERLNGEEQVWKAEKEFYPCWTGTLLIYTSPNKEFGKEISYNGLRVQIPKKWQLKKNCAIVCNHPNFTIEKDRTIVLTKPTLIRNFPQTRGWYSTEREFGIPCGTPSVRGAVNACRLERNGGHFAGLIARDYKDFCDFDYLHDVFANHHPSFWLGVLAYAKPQTEQIQK